MPKAARRLNLDIKGIVTMTVALVSFMIAITNSGKLPDGIISFAVFLIIGAVSLILFLEGRKEGQESFGPAETAYAAGNFAGNISMLMFGIVQHHRNCYPQLVLPHWVLV